ANIFARKSIGVCIVANLELNEIDKNKPQTFIIINKWRKPPDQVVKINFDAAYDEKFNQAAVGIVARESEGKVLLSCSEIYQRVSLDFVVEALACRRATQIGIDIYWEKVIIEGDSLSIIKKCKTSIPYKSKNKIVVYLVGGVPEYVEEQEERDRVRESD
ncbi:hypothetical protein Gogos_020320, partial [Gossypium gossypioides]|nr:hypothetical protein [Gossypium gossypioides]